MAKFEVLKDDIFKWVEKNGVHPQRGGATIASLCSQFGITKETYYEWMKKSYFFDGIKKANEVFKTNTCNEIVNALKKRALGYEDFKIVSVGHTVENELVIEKVQKTTVNVPPDVGASIFLLVNMDSEKWANPMKIEAKTDITSGGRPLNIVVEKEETKELLEKVKEKLANQ